MGKEQEEVLGDFLKTQPRVDKKAFILRVGGGLVYLESFIFLLYNNNRSFTDASPTGSLNSDTVEGFTLGSLASVFLYMIGKKLKRAS